MKDYLKPLIHTPLPYLAILFLLATVAWFAKYPVTSGEKYDKISNTTYGYKIEKYYCCHSTELTIWTSSGFFSETSSVYEMPQMTVDKIEKESWLNNDKAIYLNLQLKYHDSLTSVKSARIIYHFGKAEIYTSSDFTLWQTAANKINNAQFDALLLHLRQ